MAALPTVASSAHSRALGIITLITWLLTASIGAYMFGKLAASGGLRQQRAVRDGLPPAVLFGHFSLALTALVVWVSYLATRWVALAWTAVGLLMPTIGLGICTVTLWTPYPRFPPPARAPPPARQPRGPARRPRPRHRPRGPLRGRAETGPAKTPWPGRRAHPGRPRHG